MLIVYLTKLELPQQQLLQSWQHCVSYWPRSWANTEIYSAAVPVDWWLLFNNVQLADIWLIKYPENSRIIKTLFD